MESKKDSGAMWLRKTKTGDDYLSGSIEIKGEKIQFVAFLNGQKKSENQPDYRIFLKGA